MPEEGGTEDLKGVTMDLVTAAHSNNTRDTLVALRNRLAEQIEETTSGRDLASLSKQLTDVLSAIDNLPDTKTTTAADEIARAAEQRREAKQQQVT